MQEVRKDNILTLRLDDQELFLITEYSNKFYLGSKSTFIREAIMFFASHGDKHFKEMKQLSQDLYDLNKFEFKEELMKRQGSRAIKIHTHIPHMIEKFKEIQNLEISTKRKYAMIRYYFKVGKLRGYSTKQMEKELRKVGYKPEQIKIRRVKNNENNE